MRTRLAAALVLLLHLLAPVPANGPALAPPSHPSIRAAEALRTPAGIRADAAAQAVEAVLTQVLQAPGYPHEERASRGHPHAMAPAASGGLAVLPGTAVPVTGSRRAAAATAPGLPRPRPDRRAAPARAPPSSTR
ncbi:hypothetical protein [Nonomuraea rhodomycinica]|uniref:Uncharacterized protein n=1 Tax=Nonomuraea rhodomycinica TaxID=1712872 RepID=A0A7Y6IJ47_9ACTN|nr:hypothetical protein [Nonomuraea rhodomycinica]NUW38648.1 hypothetical protein [Nonomuraea rhodomycinica]